MSATFETAHIHQQGKQVINSTSCREHPYVLTFWFSDYLRMKVFTKESRFLEDTLLGDNI